MELAAFEGAWDLRRKIEDLLAGETGCLDGTARFTADDRGMIYRETGQLRMANRPEMQASRSYLWRQSGAGIAIFFEDGRPFHIIDGPEAEHLCGEDRYRVRYDFERWPCWQAVWDVSGPRKHYRMRSIYTRA